MPHREAITVLLVDDSAEDRHTYESYLRQHGDFLYTFLHAEDAEQALQLCAQSRLHCVLLDYQLPDLNGIDFLERLRADEVLTHVPAVMVTGRGNEHVAVQCLKLGAIDYLLKHEITSESLYKTVRGAVEIARLNMQVCEQQREREVAESELRESEARFRLLVDSVRDYSIVMLDPEGNVATWNAGARALFGYHDNEIVGHPYTKLFPLGEQEGSAARELKSGQERVSSERWYVRKDKRRFWASSVLAPVCDPVGLLLGYSWVVRDVTVRRRLLEALSNSLRVHAARVDDATELSQSIARLARDVDRVAMEPDEDAANGGEAAVMLDEIDRVLAAMPLKADAP